MFVVKAEMENGKNLSDTYFDDIESATTFFENCENLGLKCSLFKKIK